MENIAAIYSNFIIGSGIQERGGKEGTYIIIIQQLGSKNGIFSIMWLGISKEMDGYGGDGREFPVAGGGVDMAFGPDAGSVLAFGEVFCGKVRFLGGIGGKGKCGMLGGEGGL